MVSLLQRGGAWSAHRIARQLASPEDAVHTALARLTFRGLAQPVGVDAYVGVVVEPAGVRGAVRAALDEEFGGISEVEVASFLEALRARGFHVAADAA
ncbi:hypothetical protein [Kineococcus sp. NUM-3379]